jgi:hypothetical protein
MLRPAAVFLAALLAIALLTRGVVYLAGNDASRFAHIEALVDQHTPAIERSHFAWTVDRTFIGGHLYSNKPPLLGIVGAGLYAPLHAFGLTFREETRRTVVWILTILLAGLPTAWLAWEFFDALSLHPRISDATRLLVTTGLVLGTTVLTFSVTLSGHTFAAALLFAAFHRSVRGKSAQAGALAGLAVSVDTVPALGIAPALLFIALRGFGRKEAARLALAFVAACLLYLVANLVTIGSPWPPKMAPGGRDWADTLGTVDRGLSVVSPRRLHLGEGLFGWQGFLTTSPILVFGLAGLARAAARPAVFPRSWSAAIGLAVLVQILGRCSFDALAGGWSYGFRYLVPVIPLVMFFAPAALSGWRTAAFAAVLPASIAVALLGAYNPWPPIRERVTSQDPVIAQVGNPVGANLAAFLEERAPSSGLAAWAARAFLPPDAEDRRKYFAYFYATRGDEERCRRYDAGVAAQLP